VPSALLLIAKVLYLFAPLIASAALSGLVLRLDLCRVLYVPIDAGVTVHGKRLFGDHKTWRGVAVAWVGCVATVAAQKYLTGERAQTLCVVDYGKLNFLLFASSMAIGAMLGELPNSFAKRQMGIEPGEPARGAWGVVFYAWDQIDLLAAWVFIAPWVRPAPSLVLTSIAVAFVVHPAVSLIGYIVGARRVAR